MKKKIVQQELSCSKSFVNLGFLNTNGESKVSIDYPLCRELN